MLDGMPYREFVEWGVYFRDFDVRAVESDRRWGMMLADNRNIHRDKKKKPSPWKPSEFFPRLKRVSKTVAKGLTATEWDRKMKVLRMATG